MIPSIPALIKVLLVFVLILALNKARLTLSLSLIAGSLVLGFWMNLGPDRAAAHARRGPLLRSHGGDGLAPQQAGFSWAGLKGFLWEIMPILTAIMVFEGLMTDSRAVVEIRKELMAYRIPLVMVITVMPFLSGVVTGIAIGFVGASFPLIIPLFPAGSLFDYLSYAALAYSFGYMGMMLSPVHLCFLVTKDYFRASLLGSYRYFSLSAFSVMGAAVVLFLISRIL